VLLKAPGKGINYSRKGDMSTCRKSSFSKVGGNIIIKTSGKNSMPKKTRGKGNMEEGGGHMMIPRKYSTKKGNSRPQRSTQRILIVESRLAMGCESRHEKEGKRGSERSQQREAAQASIKRRKNLKTKGTL